MVKKVVLIVLGILGLLVGIPLALSGGTLLALGGRDGTIQSGYHAVSTSTLALVTDADELGNSNVDVRGAKVALTVDGRNPSKPLFLGVGPAQDVENYLRGASSEEITSINFSPFRLDTVRQTGSLTTIAPPTAQTFWVAQATGNAPQLVWDLNRDGNYRAVVMNADGSSAVSTELRMGLKAPALFGTGLFLLIAGLLSALTGLGLLIWGIAAKRRPATPGPAQVVPPATTPPQVG